MAIDQTAKESQDPRKGLGHRKCSTFVIPSSGSKKNKDFNDFLEKKNGKRMNEVNFRKDNNKMKSTGWVYNIVRSFKAMAQKPNQVMSHH